MNLKAGELINFSRMVDLLLTKLNLLNMPIFYKFKIFRFKTHKVFNESLGRKEGYKLNFGQIFQGILLKICPHQFCNIYVMYAHKPKLKPLLSAKELIGSRVDLNTGTLLIKN